MPIGIGFWLSPEGKIYEIFEHYEFVKEKPQLFGFSKEEANIWRTADRNLVLGEAIKRGWIRVRNHTYEAWELNQDSIFNILLHLKKIKAWEDEKFTIHELKHKKQYIFTAGDIFEGAALEYARNPKRKKNRR